MTAAEKFEHSFWLGTAFDAEGTLQRMRSLRQELCDSIAADKILGRFYHGADTTSTRAHEAVVAMINRLLVDYDRLDEVPF
jgi:hypothetical protein